LSTPDGRRVLQRLPRERYPYRAQMRHWSRQVGPRYPGIERLWESFSSWLAWRVSVCPECQILDPQPWTLDEDLCAMPDASRNCRNVQRRGDDVAHHESSAPEYLFEIRGAAARSPPHKAHRCRGRMARISRSDPLPRRAGASPASHAPTRPHFAAPLCQNLICSLRPSV